MASEIVVHDRRKGWLQSLRDRVARVFHRWLSRNGQRSSGVPIKVRRDDWPAVFSGRAFGPTVDLSDEGDALRLTAEMPGLSAEDFTVEADGRRLFLGGEKRNEHEEKRGGYRYAECRYGSFARVIPLPCEVIPEKTEATYSSGVLDVRLPKTEAARARSVRVKVN